ncbi:uncharacterized protein DUF1510 [Scopulibacillus darangshiensis]|uniref:Uncharacterized protein DUF1510 n=1 Tax=Scopulibacillus darangshiensis TaxID=442528 RepID=A0A4R2PB16_9BACL|nr:YrrS family protein [Scopulibacillus darangshiensis]TCP32293.1 uncharacterized protein DUF1510 [Scopulibacillus darangshiensis]
MGASRSSRNKKKADKVLNWAIGIVSVMILVIGGIILISLLKPTDQSASTNNSHEEQHNPQTSADQKSNDGSSDDNNGKSNDEQSNVSNDDSSSDVSADDSNADQKDKNANKEDADKANKEEDSKTQEDVPDSEHRASYDKGSSDWNAQVAALSEATGIPSGNMTIFWLGNGGGPNSSLGRVSAKNTPNKKFIVHLVYKDGQWQADNVQKPS